MISVGCWTLGLCSTVGSNFNSVLHVDCTGQAIVVDHFLGFRPTTSWDKIATISPFHISFIISRFSQPGIPSCKACDCMVRVAHREKFHENDGDGSFSLSLPSADDAARGERGVRPPQCGGGVGSNEASAALASASAGGIGRVRLTMSTPAASRKITSRFRPWGCSPGDYIDNNADENDGREESDDGTVSDDGSGDRVDRRQSGRHNTEPLTGALKTGGRRLAKRVAGDEKGKDADEKDE